jgi:hypothetical protein
MTTYARITDGVVVEIIKVESDPPIEDRYHPDIVAKLITLRGAQVTNVTEGYTYDGSSFAAPTPEPEAPKLARTYKADIWRRSTDEEAEALDSALTEAPVRLRRLWDDSQLLMHEAEEFPYLRASVIAVVGEDRADALLAPSYFEA